MNKVLMVGNIAKDVKEIQTKTGNKMASFCICVKQEYKKDGKYGVDFFDVVAFGCDAKFALAHLSKGCKVAIEGRLNNTKWTDKNGIVRYGVNVNAEKIDALTYPIVDPDGDGEGMEEYAEEAVNNEFTPAGDDEPLPF